jgi:hypothetical protein
MTMMATTEPAALIPRSWFNASAAATTMAFLMGDSQRRSHPLTEGERELGWFVLPPFQRPPVWTREQQVRFVESCWLGLPIGAFIFNRTTRYNTRFDNWLLDGQQRVTAVYAYLNDEFPVLGYRFSELSPSDYRRWGMSVQFGCLQTCINDEAKLRDIYDRLAYGGTPHKPKPSETTKARRPG